MSPSLLPRTWLLQGLLSGLCALAGYGLGVAFVTLGGGLVRILDLQVTIGHHQGRVLQVGSVIAGVALFGWATVSNIRSQAVTAAVVHLAPLTPLQWAGAFAVLAGVFGVGLGAARGLGWAGDRVRRGTIRILPASLATAAAVVVVTVVVALFTDIVVIGNAAEMISRAAATSNSRTPPGRVPPTSPLVSGGPGSSETYASLGFEGQRFVTGAPTVDQIGAATGVPAREPIRIYASFLAHPSLAATADAVVAELQRTGGFERSVLAVVTTTGTGWVNEWSMQSVEYLTGGDCATATMQYSLLPSAATVLADRATPPLAARLLFDAVYAAWLARPPEHRPRLVVTGNSLGGYGGNGAFSDVEDMLHRAQGGVWSGTPRFTPIVDSLMANRTQGSPEIAPVIDSGRHIRFVSGTQGLSVDYVGRSLARWEQPRFVYLQHPSDPVVWWSPPLMYSQPDWLREPRGHDVNPDMRWYPYATFWQLASDMTVGWSPPSGFGHRYGPELVPVWAAVLGQDTRAVSTLTAAIARTVPDDE